MCVSVCVGGWECYLWIGPELKIHLLRMSLCLRTVSTDTLLEPDTRIQSLLLEFRLETVSKLLWLSPKPATRGSMNSTCSDPLQ